MKNKAKVHLPPRLRIALKWTVYVVFTFIIFAFSTSGNPDKSKALVLIPFCLAVSCFEAEIPSTALGALGGILTDIASGQLIGFCGFYLALICGLSSAMFRQFLRKNIINYFLAVLLTCSIYLYISYFFFYRIWDFEGHELVMKARLLPSYFKTLVWSLVVFPLIWLSQKLADGTRELVIEQQDAKIDRV